MTSRKLVGGRGILLLCLCLSAQAFAQTSTFPNFDLERLELNPGAEGSLVIGTGELLPAGGLRLSALAHYERAPLLILQRQVLTALVDNKASAHLTGAYAVTDWLELGLRLPVVVLQASAVTNGAEVFTTSWGLGTPVISSRLGLLSQRIGGAADVAVELGLGLPVGNATLGHDDGLRFTPTLMAGRQFAGFHVGAQAGALIRPTVTLSPDSTRIKDEIGSELRYGGVVATTGKRLRGELDVVGSIPLSRQPLSVEVLAGVRYVLNPSIELFGIGGLGLGKAPGTPAFRLLVGGAFGNVIPPALRGAEPMTCEAGLPHSARECPNADDDGDGFLNKDDKCPRNPGKFEGCVSPPDLDNDGIADVFDECPNEPGTKERHGCPFRDKDGDGVEDSEDTCPDEKGAVENHGCPLRDRDGDGIDNDQDECPDEKGPPERHGCPEADSDKDGIPNRIDVCALAAGVPENRGCPKHENPLVEIKVDGIDISPSKIYFEPSSARLQSRSHEVLDWVARVIIEHPDQMPMVIIGAYSDDRSFPDQNRRFTQQRAEAVRQYLIDKKVPASRLEAKGYGQDRAIDSNLTSIGRENNRRVDFKFPSDDQKKPDEARPR